MPNHFHFQVWPANEGEVPAYMHWLMNAHVRQYQQHYEIVGTGHVYQGRYKNFAIQSDHHLLTVWRYVEANPLRASLVRRAEQWRWSSLSEDTTVDRPELCDGPVSRFAQWTEWVNESLPKEQLTAIRYSVRKGAPFGDDAWTASMVEQYGLHFTQRGGGRPKKP